MRARGRTRVQGGDRPEAVTDRGTDRFRDALRNELDRGRRYCRSFALVRVPLAPSGAPGRRVALPRRRRSATADGLVRSTDTALTRDGVLYLLLPEADRQSAEQCLKRLGTRLELVVTAGATVVFPEDGVTSGGLLEALGQGNGSSALGRWAGTWADPAVGDGHADVS
jgi:hypothetical protein